MRIRTKLINIPEVVLVRRLPARNRVAPVVATLGALLLFGLWPGTAAALPSIPEPSDGLAGAVESADIGADSQSEDLESAVAQEDEEEAGSGAGAHGTVAHLGVNGQEIVTGSRSRSEARDDGCKSDATVLSVLGNELFGAHAECKEGQESEDEVGLLMETCAATSGQLCIAILHGRASTRDDASERSSRSDTSAASVCAGGDQEHPDDPCTGPVGADVARSHSEASRDKRSRRAEARQESSLAEVCLGGVDPESGMCRGLGVTVLHSEGAASAAPGEEGQAEGESYTLGIEAQGEQEAKVGPGVSVPSDCAFAEDPDVCIALNQGGTDAAAGGAANRQQAAGVDVSNLVTVDLDEGEVSTTADRAGRRGPAPRSPAGRRPAARPPAAPAQAAGPLPVTGADAISFGFVGLLMIGIGATLVRRPVRGWEPLAG